VLLKKFRLPVPQSGGPWSAHNEQGRPAAAMPTGGATGREAQCAKEKSEVEAAPCTRMPGLEPA